MVREERQAQNRSVISRRGLTVQRTPSHAWSMQMEGFPSDQPYSCNMQLKLRTYHSSPDQRSTQMQRYTSYHIHYATKKGIKDKEKLSSEYHVS